MRRAAREEAVFEEVTRALAKIDEQKAAAARVEELKKRGEEQSKAFEEYEQVQANLSERIAKLAESMPMSNADRRDLQRLSDLQVERTRDLTRSSAAAPRSACCRSRCTNGTASLGDEKRSSQTPKQRRCDPAQPMRCSETARRAAPSAPTPCLLPMGGEERAAT